MRIIAFSGKAGVGKDYIATKYFKKPNSLLVSFADQLKVLVMHKYRLNFEDVYVHKPPHIRKILQTFGTEQGRNEQGLDVWCNYLDSWLKIHSYRNNIDTFLITDVRFRNELDWVHRHNGIVIRVVGDRGWYTENSNIGKHASETELDGISLDEYDFAIDNSRNPQLPLQDQIHQILRSSYFHTSQS